MTAYQPTALALARHEGRVRAVLCAMDGPAPADPGKLDPAPDRPLVIWGRETDGLLDELAGAGQAARWRAKGLLVDLAALLDSPHPADTEAGRLGLDLPAWGQEETVDARLARQAANLWHMARHPRARALWASRRVLADQNDQVRLDAPWPALAGQWLHGMTARDIPAVRYLVGGMDMSRGMGERIRDWMDRMKDPAHTEPLDTATPGGLPVRLGAGGVHGAQPGVIAERVWHNDFSSFYPHLARRMGLLDDARYGRLLDWKTRWDAQPPGPERDAWRGALKRVANTVTGLMDTPSSSWYMPRAARAMRVAGQAVCLRLADWCEQAGGRVLLVNTDGLFASGLDHNTNRQVCDRASTLTGLPISARESVLAARNVNTHVEFSLTGQVLEARGDQLATCHGPVPGARTMPPPILARMTVTWLRDRVWQPLATGHDPDLTAPNPKELDTILDHIHQHAGTRTLLAWTATTLPGPVLATTGTTPATLPGPIRVLPVTPDTPGAIRIHTIRHTPLTDTATTNRDQHGQYPRHIDPRLARARPWTFPDQGGDLTCQPAAPWTDNQRFLPIPHAWHNLDPHTIRDLDQHLDRAAITQAALDHITGRWARAKKGTP